MDTKESAEAEAEEIQTEQQQNANLTEHRITIPSLEERLITEESKERRFFHFLRANCSIKWYSNLKFPSPLKYFQEKLDKREEISISVPSPVGIRCHFHIKFMRKINFASIFSNCKNRLKNPKNIALLIWFLCVAASATMLVLLLLGVLNRAFPTKTLRNRWIEINNQVLNALFTLMSLYEHPNLFHHLFLLFRWSYEDVIQLRKIYCKNGAYRPHEWAHMVVIVVLLHITCFSQYVLCGLYWGYTSKNRPEFAENFFFILGVAAPIFAGLYMVYSSLGREFEYESDQDHVNQSNKTGLHLYERMVVVSDPEWAGGLLDCSEDSTVWYLSLFCTCCVFGWNMERLGFGNMYVHMFTFLLLCIAPFWVFNISALNIHNLVLSDVIGYVGILLCFFGLLYGGYWRIQMRKKYKLPGNKFCCGSNTMTDYAKWLFCWSCALAQEVRTGNLYGVGDDSFYRNLVNGEGDEAGSSSVIVCEPEDSLEVIEESNRLDDLNNNSRSVVGDVMSAPSQPMIEGENRVDYSH